MVNDGQFCVIKETNELVRFVGNMYGDYHYNLGVIEDSLDHIRIIRLYDIRPISDEEARELDPFVYEILSKDYYGDDE